MSGKQPALEELSDFQGRLLAALMVEAEQGRDRVKDASLQHERRREALLRLPRLAPSGLATLGTVGLITVLAMLVVLLPVGDQRAAVAVERLESGVIRVSLQPTFGDADRLQEQLVAQGLRVSAARVPVSPSRVGSLVDLGLSGSPDGLAIEQTAPTGSITGFTLDPRRFSGELRLFVGAEADSGETYVASNEAFEPGEVLAGLHCDLGRLVRSEDVERLADQAGLRVQWEVVRQPARDESSGLPIGLMTDEVRQRPEGLVYSAYAASPEELIVLVVGMPQAAGLTPRLSDVPCQSESYR